LQEELFETCGMQELVEAALDGYSVTIFAFGQTGKHDPLCATQALDS
jgi:hypothetical protein